MSRWLPEPATESLLRKAVRCCVGESARRAASLPCLSKTEALDGEAENATMTPERLTATLFEQCATGSISVYADFDQIDEPADLPVDLALTTETLFLRTACKLPSNSLDLLRSGSDGSTAKRLSTLFEPVAGRRVSFGRMFTSESCDDAIDLL
ncbi:hypothetical protein MRX96_029143 [Rhipicephalus microplus]